MTMRPCGIRVSIRAARAASSGSTSHSISNRTHQSTRQVCTNTAVSPDPKLKAENDNFSKDVNDMMRNEHPARVQTEDSQVSTVVTQNIETDSKEEVHIPLTLGVEQEASENIVESLGAQEASGEVGPEGLNTQTSPSQKSSSIRGNLLERLQGLLGRNANRSALFEYGTALKAENAPEINAQVVKMMLPGMGRNSWGTTAFESLKLSIKRGYQIPVGTLNCGFHAMSRVGMAKEIEEVLDSMWANPSETNPNATSYNYLIAAYVYKGNVDNAFNVLNDMKKHLVYPTFATYHALIAGCLRRRDPRRAYQTLIAVERQRFDISAMTIAQVMVASAANDDYDHVLHLLSKFEECLPMYGTELHRIAEQRNLYRMTTAERTTKGDREILRGDPKPEIGALSEVLHCAFRGGRADLASRAWMLLEEHYPQYEPPASLWYCLIGAYAGAGEFSKAIDFVGVMRERGLQPSMKDLDMALTRSLSFDVGAIDEQFFRLCDRFDGKEGSSGNNAKPEKYVSAKSEQTTHEGDLTSNTAEAMDSSNDEIGVPQEDATANEASDGSSPTTETPDAAFGEDVLRSDVQTTNLDIFADRIPTSVGIDELNCIMAACSAAQDLDRAFQTYDEIGSRFKLERNVDTYNALLEGCVQTRRIGGGMRVVQEMENLGIPISGYTLHLVARMFLRAGRQDDLLQRLRKATDEEAEISIQTYQMVLRQLCKANMYDKAAQLLEQGISDGYNVSAMTGRFDMNTARTLKAIASGEPLPGNEENSVSEEHFDEEAEDLDDMAADGSEEPTSSTNSEDAIAEKQ